MDRKTSWTHTVALAPEPASAARARDFVCAHLLVHSLLGLVDDVRLVVSELATNAMQHAGTPFTVTLEREGHSVRLTVEDGSPERPTPRSPGETDLRGRGLTIVGGLANHWGVAASEKGGKSVWVSFPTGRTMAPDW